MNKKISRLHFGVISIFPEMFYALDFGITGRAQREKRITVNYWNPRNYTNDPRHRVDDRPYGGGPGMIMKYEPLYASIVAASETLGNNSRVIYLSPQGQTLTHNILVTLLTDVPLILLAGRYEGIDERLIEKCVDKEYSVGDYVLTGGELPSMILIDALTRLLPGVLGHEDSALQDSFSNGLLDHSHYTRPASIAKRKVPNVLLSGDHKAIERWQVKKSLERTWQRRPNLLETRSLTTIERILLDEVIYEDRGRNIT